MKRNPTAKRPCGCKDLRDIARASARMTPPRERKAERVRLAAQLKR